MSLSALLDVRDGTAPGITAAAGGAQGRGFGGHLAALALVAAYETVPEPLVVRHIHVEFLRPALVGPSVDLDVTRIRDGRTTAHRLVEVRQRGRDVVTAVVVFHRPDAEGPDHQLPMPAVPGHDEIARGRSAPVEVHSAGDAADPSRQHTWIRPAERPLSDDPRVHEAILLYMSDLTVLWPALRVHGYDPDRFRHSALGSLSHTVWFHRQVRTDGWLLYEQVTPSTSGGLCHGEGRIFTHDGRLAASVVQVGVLRPPRGEGQPAAPG